MSRLYLTTWAAQSRPARGAWIEIPAQRQGRFILESRPARGAWIEIKFTPVVLASTSSRAPQGARGLKYQLRIVQHGEYQSRPARGAWIEIPPYAASIWQSPVAPRKGRVD